MFVILILRIRIQGAESLRIRIQEAESFQIRILKIT